MVPSLDLVRRTQFPALADKSFLDAACASLAPQAAADAIGALLRDVQTYPERSATAFHIRLDAARDAARPAAARLIGARPDDIALVENTSHGLAIAAAAIPLEAGDNILVPDFEYLQVPLPWRQQPASSAPEIRLVPRRQRHAACRPVRRRRGRPDPRRRDELGPVVERLPRRSRRHRRLLPRATDLVRRGRHPAARGISHRRRAHADRHPGHRRPQVAERPVRRGFMYINPAVRDRLRPSVAGYLSVNPPEGGWAEYSAHRESHPLQPVTFTAGARRYETGGTGNYAGAAGLTASLGLINSLGPASIGDHIVGLTDQLLDGLSGCPSAS